MMTALKNFLREHIWGSIVTSFIAGAGALFATFTAIEQSRVERFETSMMGEYQAVATSKRELYTSLDKFTASLAQGETPDANLISEMNGKLLDLRERVDTFNIGLNGPDREKISAVKNALAAMKIEIARAKTKDDLQYVAGRLAEFEMAYKAVRPIVERKIGVPNEMLSG